MAAGDPVKTPLLAKQKAFVNYYVEHEFDKDFSPKDASLHAGYAESGAACQASRLVLEPRIIAAIKESREKLDMLTIYSRNGQLKKLDLLYREANQQGTINDRKTCVQIIQEQNKMLGYYEADKKQIEIVTKLSDDDLDAEIDRLAAISSDDD